MPGGQSSQATKGLDTTSPPSIPGLLDPTSDRNQPTNNVRRFQGGVGGAELGRQRAPRSSGSTRINRTICSSGSGRNAFAPATRLPHPPCQGFARLQSDIHLRIAAWLTPAARPTARMPPWPRPRTSVHQQPPLSLVQVPEQHHELHSKLITSYAWTSTSTNLKSDTLMIGRPLTRRRSRLGEEVSEQHESAVNAD